MESTENLPAGSAVLATVRIGPEDVCHFAVSHPRCVCVCGSRVMSRGAQERETQLSCLGWLCHLLKERFLSGLLESSIITDDLKSWHEPEEQRDSLWGESVTQVPR